MPDLSIKSVEVTAVGGENKSPVNGNVLFSDDKYYGWTMRDNKVRFFGYRTIYGRETRVMLRSEKRAKLLTHWIDTNDWSLTKFVIKKQLE